MAEPEEAELYVEGEDTAYEDQEIAYQDVADEAAAEAEAEAAAEGEPEEAAAAAAPPRSARVRKGGRR